MKRTYLCVVGVSLATLIMLSGSVHGEAITFHVAPTGNDAWSGKVAEADANGPDGPFATVARAQKAVRELRTDGRLPGPIIVRISGVHRLAEPVVLTAEDSGTAECPVTYAGDPREKPILSGGRPITGWQKGAGELWTAPISEVKDGKWYFRQLFINGRRATRARTPNDGFLQVAGLVDPKPGAPWNEGVDRFRFKPGDIRPYGDLQNVEAVVFHSWNTSRVRIAQVDEAAGIVSFTGPTIFRPLGWDPKQRYYVENARELLDAPGEWYLDRTTGTLTYWPLPGEDLATAEVIAPVLGELVRLDGDPDTGKFVDHVHLVDLRLEHADWSLPHKGYGDPQAAVTVPAVVSAKGARHCSIEGCEIAHVGTYGIWFSRGCKENRIERNHLHDLGAGGIRIGELQMAATDVAEATGNLITNNYLHDGGQVYAAGVGLWVAQSSHNTLSHNEIHSFDYSGISIGWNWSDAPNRTHHNTVEFNHVHHVMRGVLSDGGGIYTLGVQPGMVLRNNVFHDIWPYLGSPAMAWGIYFDQGSSGMLVENNIVYHTLTGGIMNTGSGGITVRNNIFALSAWQSAWRYTFQKDPPSVVERNIFYLTQGELFHNDAGRTDYRSKWDYNLYWRTDGQPLWFYDEEVAEWQAKGVDRHSLVADPRFVDPARFDFRLQAESPALKLGFQPIDVSQVGLIGPTAWRDLPKQAVVPPTVLPAAPTPPGPTLVDDGFEATATGELPGLATVSEEGRGDSIRVTTDAAATGQQSLRFTDSPGLAHSFNPHLFYSPHARTGRAVLRFDVRLEPGAVLAHEWRDGTSPYRVGPSLLMTAGGKLVANGRPLADVPAGKWLHVEIACTLGKESPGTYALKVGLSGAPPQVFSSLSFSSNQFNRLEWLGFVSLAQDKTAIYLDNVKLDVEAAKQASR